jgi:hypothetical protein|tara:strand:+ start:79 stop:276 length:198 start_codon:yes stop_codon:yes gene_type:complete
VNYGLFNKKLQRRLVHPKIGLWFTSNLDEAKNMLESCHEYLRATKMENMCEFFVIIDVESGDEID